MRASCQVSSRRRGNMHQHWTRRSKRRKFWSKSKILAKKRIACQTNQLKKSRLSSSSRKKHSKVRKQSKNLAIAGSPGVSSFTVNALRTTDIVGQLVLVPAAITCRRSIAQDCIPNNKYLWGIRWRLDQRLKGNKKKLLNQLIPHTPLMSPNRSCRTNCLRRGT